MQAVALMRHVLAAGIRHRKDFTPAVSIRKTLVRRVGKETVTL
jgi:hypothetical protein